MSVAHEHGHELSFLRKYIFSTDHKVIGIQFLFSSLIFLVLVMALLVGAQNIMSGFFGRGAEIAMSEEPRKPLAFVAGEFDGAENREAADEVAARRWA